MCTLVRKEYDTKRSLYKRSKRKHTRQNLPRPAISSRGQLQNLFFAMASAASNHTSGVEGQAECFVQQIMACFEQLSQFEDLKPNGIVNAAFERLVAICVRVPGEHVVSKVGFVLRGSLNSWPVCEANWRGQVFSEPRIVATALQLRLLCSEGESQLEMMWAGKVGSCRTQEEG